MRTSWHKSELKGEKSWQWIHVGLKKKKKKWFKFKKMNWHWSELYHTIYYNIIWIIHNLPFVWSQICKFQSFHLLSKQFSLRIGTISILNDCIVSYNERTILSIIFTRESETNFYSGKILIIFSFHLNNSSPIYTSGYEITITYVVFFQSNTIHLWQ